MRLSERTFPFRAVSRNTGKLLRGRVACRRLFALGVCCNAVSDGLQWLQKKKKKRNGLTEWSVSFKGRDVFFFYGVINKNKLINDILKDAASALPIIELKQKKKKTYN